MVRRRASYALKWLEAFGLGTPTTCVYQFVHDSVEEEERQDLEIEQLFVMSGLGICVRLGSHIGHSFYGHVFKHCTAVGLVKRGGRLFFSLNDSRFTVFAWGGGGPAKETEGTS